MVTTLILGFILTIFAEWVLKGEKLKEYDKRLNEPVHLSLNIILVIVCTMAVSIIFTMPLQYFLVYAYSNIINEQQHIGKTIMDNNGVNVAKYYDCSGKLGDIGDVSIERSTDYDHFIYQVEGRGIHEWDYKYINGALNINPAMFAGVMYLDPPNNWGTDPKGGYDLRKYSKTITWEARSTNGTCNVEFVIGGINWIWNDTTKEKSPYPDSLSRKSLGVYTLNDSWQTYSYDLSPISDDEFKRVIGGFGWVASWSSNHIRINDNRTGPENPKTIEIDIRNIRYEG